MATAFTQLERPRTLPGLLALCEACFPEDPFSEDLLRKNIFGDPRFEPELALVVERDGRLAAVAVSVHPHHAGGRAAGLAQAAGRRSGLPRPGAGQGDARRTGDPLPCPAGGRVHHPGRAVLLFWPGVEVRRTPALLPVRATRLQGAAVHTVNMTVDLNAQTFETAGDEQRLGTRGLRLPPASDAASLLAISAFVGRHWQPWCDEIALTMANNPGVHVPRHSQRRSRGLCGPTTRVMFRGTFGPMGTDPSLRGKGVGDVLLKKCFRDMKDFNYPPRRHRLGRPDRLLRQTDRSDDSIGCFGCMGRGIQ